MMRFYYNKICRGFDREETRSMYDEVDGNPSACRKELAEIMNGAGLIISSYLLMTSHSRKNLLLINDVMYIVGRIIESLPDQATI